MLKYRITISDIVIDVERKRINNLRLSVHPPDGRVQISAPLFYNEESLKTFIRSKLLWIKKHKDKYLNNGNNIQLPYEYVSGEKHYYLGDEYILSVVNHNKSPRIELHEKSIGLFIKTGNTKLKRKRILDEWYRKQLKDTALTLISKWEKILGVSINEFGIKNMKTRWGSCNIRAKRIWLNLELAKMPLHCVEFIIVHELVHLLERNHNARFKSYMDRFIPQWRSYKKELSRFPLNIPGREF
jgi:predicted metal-dependent hydrolase